MSIEPLYTYHKGSVPLLVNMPHTATHVPHELLSRFTGKARQLPDTDWHIERLYSFARALGAHVLIPAYSRYVIDLNRSSADEPLYPGRFTTGLCPHTLFDGSALYLPGQEPGAEEVALRIRHYWQPYHDKLQSVLNEMRMQHGQVALFDAHSIRSQVPALFEGVLPDLNIGTAGGMSADGGITEALLACARESGYSTVCNGRFKGGYNTRHYGSPQAGIHAVQLELAQKNYMDEDYPFAYDEGKAARLQGTLQRMLETLIQKISR